MTTKPPTATHAQSSPDGNKYTWVLSGQQVFAGETTRLASHLRSTQDKWLHDQQIFAGETTRLAHMTDEAVEGRDSFLQKRHPDWSEFPYYY